MPGAVKKKRGVARCNNLAAVTARSSGRTLVNASRAWAVDRGVSLVVAGGLPRLGAAAAVDPLPVAGGDCAGLSHVHADKPI